jgi:hypothetical protein
MYNIEQSQMGRFPVYTAVEGGGLTTNRTKPDLSDSAGGLYDEEGVLLRLST